MKKNNVELSAEKAIEQIKEIQQLQYVLPKSGEVKTKIPQSFQLQARLINMKI